MRCGVIWGQWLNLLFRSLKFQAETPQILPFWPQAWYQKLLKIKTNYYFRKIKTKNNNTKTARMPISEGSCCPRIRSFWKNFWKDEKKFLMTSSTIFWPRPFIDSFIFVTVEFQFAQRVSDSVESSREKSLFSPFSLLASKFWALAEAEGAAKFYNS